MGNMMTALCPGPPTPPSVNGSLATATTAVPFHYVQTDSFVALLRQLNASLLVTTYQANKLLVVRENNGGLSTLVRTFERPVGVAADAGRLALCTRGEIWLFRDAPDIAPRLEPAGRHDACFLPRCCHITGDIAAMKLPGLATSCGLSTAAFPACVPCSLTT